MAEEDFPEAGLAAAAEAHSRIRGTPYTSAPLPDYESGTPAPPFALYLLTGFRGRYFFLTIEAIAAVPIITAISFCGRWS